MQDDDVCHKDDVWWANGEFMPTSVTLEKDYRFACSTAENYAASWNKLERYQAMVKDDKGGVFEPIPRPTKTQPEDPDQLR